MPRVDERVELLSIVFRLAGNSEYNMNLLPAYTVEIDRYFAPYKDHPAVVAAPAGGNQKHWLRRRNGDGDFALRAAGIETLGSVYGGRTRPAMGRGAR